MRGKGRAAADFAIARNVRLHRMAKGLSQADVARQLGVTFQQVQKYETGANRIGTGRLVRIAKILAVPLTVLLDGIDRAASSAPHSGLHLIQGASAFRLAQAFAAIKEPGLRRSLVLLVEMTAKACARGARGHRRA
ncbi:MAG TPA: helix-turn-helix transcriptional regulator [Xanthobacteraceae bacterium]|jgi:transcriptional regulator with XRE-family HTH domain|nr:helix-turn-helix transcriptional regulator [Xanthobacteraceae bacterium]